MVEEWDCGKGHILDLKKWQKDEATRLAPVHGKVTYHTMDIIHPENPDIFDYHNWYIKSNLEFYDAIFLPDCGGAWFEAQRGDNSQEDICEDLFALLIPSLMMLKPGGYLYVGKFINKCDPHCFTNHAASYDAVKEAIVIKIRSKYYGELEHVRIEKRK